MFFYLLIAGYYFIKPVRDAVFLHRKGFDQLPRYQVIVAIGTLVLALLYNQVVDRVSRRRLILGVYGFFLVGTAAFAALLRSGAADPAAAFYIALSIFNLLLTCVFWSTTNDVFGVEEGRRWYGLIALAGPLGALTGSAGAGHLVKTTGSVNLLWISLPFFAGALALGLALDAAGRRFPPSDAARVQAGPMFPDLRLLVNVPYVRGIFVLVSLGTLVTTLYYFDFNRLLAKAGLTEDAKAAWVARRMVMENVLGIAVQLCVTPWLLRRHGPGPALLLMPVAMLAGALGLGGWETLPVATAVMVAGGGLGYTINQAAKELLYVPTDKTIKYQAKSLVDVFGFRLGDATAALLVLTIQPILKARFGDDFRPFLGLAAILSVAWLLWARKAGSAFEASQGARTP